MLNWNKEALKDIQRFATLAEEFIDSTDNEDCSRTEKALKAIEAEFGQRIAAFIYGIVYDAFDEIAEKAKQFEEGS